MKKLLLSVGIFLASSITAFANPPIEMWYESPAADWNQALPVGNGHIGAMVFGDPYKEQLQLNENTLYSGDPQSAQSDLSISKDKVNHVFGMIKAGQYAEAQEEMRQNWLYKLHENYQPLGDLYITNNIKGEVSSYRRSLNLSDAISVTNYTQNGVNYTREVFASNPDNVIVISIEADKKKSIDITLNLGSVHPTAKQTINSENIILEGKVPGYAQRRSFKQLEAWGNTSRHPELYDKDGNRRFDYQVLYGDDVNNRGMLFAADLKPILGKGAKMEQTTEGLRIYNTNKVYLVMSLATSYNGFKKDPATEGVDPVAKNTSIIALAQKLSLKTLRQSHIEDYQTLFNRVSLNLPSDPSCTALPTDQRIINFASHNDPNLAELLFNFGRYLVISGSREGGQPLNLQGMWNKDVVPAWGCGYTMNINAQMNYWPAEVGNLSECHQPIFTLISELMESGTQTAKKVYGNRGWVAHHNTSIWRETFTNDYDPRASFWPMAQAWIIAHLYEHYLYTQDEEFLRTVVYPAYKGASEFMSDWLVDRGDGVLVTPVGASPENKFVYGDGKVAAMAMAPTMDMALCREVFNRTVEMAEKFDLDTDLQAELKGKVEKLVPYQITSKGQLQEWMTEMIEEDPQHRHISHLYGFHPGDQITIDKTPKLWNAVRRSLEIRGDMATGWSMGWKINCWARMFDGDHAYKIIHNLFHPIDFGPKDPNYKGGGLYRNMFDACPPFQIDGNFGFTAGVMEMLMQSHGGYIHLLPALPSVWPTGSISGIRARGAFEVGINWNQSKMTSATIESIEGKDCVVRAFQPISIKELPSLQAKKIDINGFTMYELAFATQKGNTYNIVAR